MKTNNIIDITLFLQECERIKNEGKGEITRVEYNPTSSFEEGERHDRLVKLAGSLSRQGLGLATLTDTLLSLNDSLCTVPLPDKEVREIAKSIDKYKNYDRNPELQENRDSKRKILALLYKKGRVSIKTSQDIADIILSDFNNSGVFVRTQNNDYYYFLRETKTLFSFEYSCAEYKQILMQYHINPQLPVFKFITEALKNHCFTTGELVEVYKYVHYDKYNNIVYLKCGNKNLYRITADDIAYCDNGTDGVLFTSVIEMDEFEYQGDIGKTDYLTDYVISLSSFNELALDIQTQETLAKAFFIGLFFPELLETKPILTVMGEKGSGKTTLLKAFMKILYGAKYTVFTLPNKLEDFEVLVANTHFCPLDNVDAELKGFPDKLATAATGGKSPKRKLYTDGENYLIDLNAFIGISTRELNFKRDDILQRLLLLSVKPIEGGYIPESELFAPVIKYRDKIMSQVINEVQNVLKVIETKKFDRYKSGFRMSDFAKFLAIYLDDIDKAEEHLYKMSKFQQNTDIENDILISYIGEFTREYNEIYFTAGEIYSLIIEKIKKVDNPFYNNEFVRTYKNVFSFAKRLNNIRNEIKDFIDIQLRKGRANQTEYFFTKGEKFNDIKRVSKFETSEAEDEDDIL